MIISFIVFVEDLALYKIYAVLLPPPPLMMIMLLLIFLMIIMTFDIL